MVWPFFSRRAARQALKPAFPNVVFFTADACYLQLAWLAARDAAAQEGRNFDVVLLVLRGHGAENLAAPPGCSLLEITLPDWVRRWPMPAHMSIANYARLFAADLWLAQWERALYLDSDILIREKLAPLFAIDLRGGLAALVEDCGYCRRDADGNAARRQILLSIGLDPDTTYFNAGVLMFDVKLWRQAKVTRQLARFKEVQSKYTGSVDQDFVNWTVRGRVVELSPRWNFQTHYLGLGLETMMQPHIVHYLDLLKPWRDPEWGEVYDREHAEIFAARLAADRMFGPGPAQSLQLRSHPDAVFAGHTDNIRRERGIVRTNVLARISAAASGYADLTSSEIKLWQQALIELAAADGKVPAT